MVQDKQCKLQCFWFISKKTWNELKHETTNLGYSMRMELLLQRGKESLPSLIRWSPLPTFAMRLQIRLVYKMLHRNHRLHHRIETRCRWRDGTWVKGHLQPIPIPLQERMTSQNSTPKKYNRMSLH